jgi:hypothetical protein
MPSFIELQELYKDNLTKLIDSISKETIDPIAGGLKERKTEDYLKEYSGDRSRRAKSVGMRENKTVDTYSEDATTMEVTKSGTKTVLVSKISLPFPKKIVRTRNHFLFGGKMVVSGGESGDALNEFKKVWSKDLKMQNVLKALARTCMVETKAAVIFYPSPAIIEGKPGLKLRCQLLNRSKGDFFPHFDDFGDMDAFIYRYTGTNDGKDVAKARIYTDQTIITYMKDGSSWLEDPISKPVPNLFTKIPVVYVEQDEPEWEQVTSMIDNFEMRISRLADTNDYFAEPLLKLFGKVTRAPGKDEVGKMLEFEMTEGSDGKPLHGDAEYATWDHTPESIKLDLETSWDGIFSMTSTPDLSFNNVKGLNNVSGVALRLMFLDAFIAREEKMEIFDPALRRCVSVVAAGIGGYTNVAMANALSLDDIDVTFTDILPEDVRELIDTISIATGAKSFLSQESAISISPLTKDSDEELTRIKGEESSSLNEPVII